MVYRKMKPERTTFRKLPTGAAYWDSDDLTVAPAIKLGRRTALKGWTTTTGAPTTNAIVDTSFAVVRVPQAFTG